jgi:amino acid permease
MDNQYMSVVEFFAQNPGQYMWQVYVPIMIWLIVVLAFFIILLKKYTFGNWTAEKPNPYAGETFDMPRGVFRGTLTLSLLFIVVILELVNVRIIGFEDEIKELMVAFQMMIAFYFGSKVMHHMTSTDRKKTEVIAEQTSYVQTTQTKGEFDDESAAG